MMIADPIYLAVPYPRTGMGCPSLPARNEWGESRREGCSEQRRLLSPALSSASQRRGRRLLRQFGSGVQGAKGHFGEISRCTLSLRGGEGGLWPGEGHPNRAENYSRFVSSVAANSARNFILSTLPKPVSGNFSRSSMRRGILYSARPFWQCALISSALNVAPGRGTT